MTATKKNAIQSLIVSQIDCMRKNWDEIEKTWKINQSVKTVPVIGHVIEASK